MFLEGTLCVGYFKRKFTGKQESLLRQTQTLQVPDSEGTLGRPEVFSESFSESLHSSEMVSYVCQALTLGVHGMSFAKLIS